MSKPCTWKLEVQEHLGPGSVLRVLPGPVLPRTRPSSDPKCQGWQTLHGPTASSVCLLFPGSVPPHSVPCALPSKPSSWVSACVLSSRSCTEGWGWLWWLCPRADFYLRTLSLASWVTLWFRPNTEASWGFAARALMPKCCRISLHRLEGTDTQL